MRVVRTMQATSSMFCAHFYTMSRPVKYGFKWIALELSLKLHSIQNKYIHIILTILRSRLAGIHLTFQNRPEPLYLSIIFPCVHRIPERKDTITVKIQ